MGSCFRPTSQPYRQKVKYTNMYTNTYTNMYTNIYTQIYTHKYIHKYSHKYILQRTQIYTQINTHTYTHVYGAMLNHLVTRAARLPTGYRSSLDSVCSVRMVPIVRTSERERQRESESV